MKIKTYPTDRTVKTGKRFYLLIKSPILQYLLTKYITYAIQFINAILIAKYLGLYYFGIYCFVQLLFQYLAYTNLGINHSLNVILSTETGKRSEKPSEIVSVSFFITSLVSIGLFVLLLGAYFIGLFSNTDKYITGKYILLVVIIVIIQHFNSLFLNLFRVYGKIKEININCIITPILQIVSIIVFKEQKLFWSLIYSYLAGNIISLGIYIYKSPVQIKVKYTKDSTIIKRLLTRGVNLLGFNLSFYLIMISARTLVSYFYRIEDFGLYSFANNLALAIMLMLDSITFLLYPKILNKISQINENGELKVFIERIQMYYTTIALFIVFSSILLLPIVFRILPEYGPSSIIFKYLLFAQIIISISFGYSILLVEKKKEKCLAFCGFISIGIVLLVGATFFYILDYSFEKIAIAVLIGALFYNYGVVYLGNKITKQFHNRWQLLSYIFSYKYSTPVIAYILLEIFLKNELFVIIVTISIYFIINYNEIKEILKGSANIISNENILKDLIQNT